MLSAGRTFPFGEKAIFSHNQKQLYKKPKKLLHIFSKEKEKESYFSKHKSIRTNQKQKQKFFFFSILILKQHSFKSNKRQDLNFQAKNTIKTVNTLWKENQYCINISFLLLSLLFLIILFNLLFDSIYFFYFVDYFIY